MDGAAVEKTILDYLAQPQPAVSLMISGRWGAGKTHYLLSRKSAIEAHSGKRLALVSVAGLSTREELEHALFAAYAPWMVSGYAQAAAPLMKAAMRLVKLEPKDFRFSADFKPEQSAVVLDDVDRFHGDIRVLIGFIVDLVDQSRLHTLLIASEKDMQEAKKFAELKEKIVGVTVHIQADVDARLDEFINAVVSEPVRTRLQAHRLDLSSAAASWGVGNLRSLKHAVARLAALLGEFGDRLDEIGEHRRLLVGGVFIGLLEIARDESQTEAVADIFSTPSVGAAASLRYMIFNRADEWAVIESKEKGPPAADKAPLSDATAGLDAQKQRIIREYPLFELDSFPGSAAFGLYFKHGTIDTATMIEPFLEMQRQHSPRERLLSDYRQLSQADFDRETMALLEDLRAGKISTLTAIANGYLTLRHFALERTIDADLHEVASAVLNAVRATDETKLSDADTQIKYWPGNLFEPEDKEIRLALQGKQAAVKNLLSESDRLEVLDPGQSAPSLAQRLQKWGDGELFVGEPAPYVARVGRFSPEQLHALVQFLQNRMQRLSERHVDWWHEPDSIEKIAEKLDPSLAAFPSRLTVVAAERARLARVMRDYATKVRDTFAAEREKYKSALERRAELEKSLPPSPPSP